MFALLVGQHRPVEAGIVGDAAVVMKALAAQFGGKDQACWFAAAALRLRKRAALVQRAGPVPTVIEDLRAALPDDTIFVNDLTVAGYWMALLLETHEPRTLIHPGTYGTLGYALPAAIGAKLGSSRQPVVSISGDGGFLFAMQELAKARARFTVKKCPAPVAFSKGGT